MIIKSKTTKTPILLNEDEYAKVCRALGHPARVQIIRHLKQAGQCICGQIVNLFPLAQSTVSQHLKSLKEAGLVLGTVEGPRTCYCLNKELLKRFQETTASISLLKEDHPHDEQ